MTGLVNQSDAFGLSIDDVLHLALSPVVNVGRTVYILWFILGLVGNILSTRIWMLPSMYNTCSSAHYLAAISICDLVCQCLHVFHYLAFFWRLNAFPTTDLCQFWSLMYMIPQYVSHLLVLGFTVESLISVTNPFRKERFSRYNRGPKEIVGIIIFVSALSIPQAFFWKVDNMDHCDADRIGTGMEYAIWNWSTDIAMYIVVPFVTVIINCSIIKASRRTNYGLNSIAVQTDLSRRSNIKKMTRSLRESTYVLLCLSFFRVFTLFPITCLRYLQTLDYFNPVHLQRVYTYEDVAKDELWQRFIVFSGVKLCFDLIGASRISLNILIFVKTSPKFRKHLRKYCSCCGKTI